MKRFLPIVTCFILLLSAQTLLSQASQAIVHTAGAANITLNWTSIDHPSLNGDATAIIITTPNWNPPGSSGVYFPYNPGVWYDFTGKWAIFNQDNSLGMTEGAAFNVWISGDDVSAYVHTVTAGNVLDNFTYLDHPSLNNNPNAIFFVDQNYGSLAVYNNQPIGIWYDEFEKKWGVFNQDYFVNMPVGASFNVMIPHDDYGAFVHKADAGNISSNYTYLDHPDLNGNPDAILVITSNWNPPGSSGVYLNEALGVWYDGSQWAIFNQNFLNDMTEGAAFNVLVYTELTAVSEVPASGSVKAYPNPSSGLVSFAGAQEGDLLRLFSSNGKLLGEWNLKNGGADLSKAILPGQGLYTYSLFSNEGLSVSSGKLVLVK